MLTIGFAGDVMIGRLVDEYTSKHTRHSIWGNLLPYFQKNDLNIINLEAALTRSPHIVPKVFNFKAVPEKASFLKEASISLVNLANNHVLDYNKEGLFETLHTLDNASILHVGAGKNLEDAKKPVILSKNGIKVGVLGYTDNEPDWIATSQKAGINYVEIGDIKAVEKDIKDLREKVDYLFVSLHWGPNMRERPTKLFQNFAHELIDRGVDLIFGHSAHIFQGVEQYKNGLILYDTGDFVDDYYVDPYLRNDRSFFFVLEIEKDVLNLHLLPVLISNFQVNTSEGRDREETIQRMKILSSEFHTSFEEITEFFGTVSLKHTVK